MARQPRQPRAPRAPRSLIDDVNRELGKPRSDPREPESYAKFASVADVTQEDLQRLLDENRRLLDELQVEKSARTAAEEAALASAQAQGMLMQRQIQEVPTGKTATVKRLSHYESKGWNGDREMFRPIFKPVKLPTYFYKVDLPPCGGTDLKINGLPLYHGGVYELDVDTLRTVKEIVYRCWKHDAEIHGDRGEQFYRKENRPTLSMRAYG